MIRGKGLGAYLHASSPCGAWFRESTCCTWGAVVNHVESSAEWVRYLVARPHFERIVKDQRTG